MDRLELYRQMRDELTARRRSLEGQLKALDNLETQRTLLQTGLKVIDEELAEYEASIKELTPPDKLEPAQ